MSRISHSLEPPDLTKVAKYNNSGIFAGQFVQFSRISIVEILGFSRIFLPICNYLNGIFFACINFPKAWKFWSNLQKIVPRNIIFVMFIELFRLQDISGFFLHFYLKFQGFPGFFKTVLKIQDFSGCWQTCLFL